MKKQLFYTAAFCLASLCAISASAEKTLGVMSQTNYVDASNTRITNKFCDTSQPICACEKASNPGPATPPANGCVQIDLGLGRTRYSSLTKDVVLQLNEITPSSRLYSPNGLRVVAGYSVYSIARDKNAGGVPAWVQMVTPIGILSSFGFAEGESVGVPMGGLAGRVSERLAMVDAQGWATAADPAFYDFYPGDGSRWRFGASRAAPDYLQIVEHQTPEGRVETRQDLGLEIFCDENGVLRQVVTPAYLADFRVTGQESYELRIYPNEPSCVPGTRAAGGWYDVAAGAVYEAFWTFTNATPSVYGTLDVICRRPGAADQSWRYTYMEALQDFTLRSDQTGLRESLARFTSDDGRSMVLRRVKSDADGKAYSQTELRYESRGGAMELVATVRDPGGLNLAETYGYYTDGAAAGLQRQAVNEDGSWVRYEYDASRRKTAEIRPWLDAPTNAPAEQCAVTRYAYAPFAPGDFLRFNDQRPRTVVGEVCGVEVSRTYHAYPTNALGQAQEIEERAAFPAAPYGHASNPRTVKTFYAPSAAVPLAGRLATVTYPGGKTETYGYEYGTFNAATFAFAADPDGGAWRETVTTSYGENSGVQVLRSARVWDEKGREVLNESYVEDGAAFALIGWKRMSYDRSGNLTETAYSDGRVESATWGANCCGKESETAADGTTMVYGYNLLKQKVSETKKGMAADGSDDIMTLHEYDLEGNRLKTTVTNYASGLGYVDFCNAYDAVGRLTNVIDLLGNATTYFYLGTGDQQVAPNGVTTLTEHRLEGQTKRTLENGVVKQSYAYGVINPEGLRWTLSALGALPDVAPLATVADLQALVCGLDFPWSFSVSDPLGRTVFEGKPGFGGSALVTSNAYDIAGNLLCSARYAIGGGGFANPAILSENLYAYGADSSLLFAALDLNTNGVIDLEGHDRITGTAAGYEKDASNVWWLISRSWVYPEFNSSAAVTTSVQRVQLTGLGAQQGDDGMLTSQSQSFDVRGNVTSSSTIIDCTARKVTQVKSLPTSVQSSIQITVNGLLKKTGASTTVTNMFGYDLLGRRIAATDGRENTTISAYNPQGLVVYTDDAATNRTSYAYDTLGRRTEVMDALGNVNHTAYDVEGRVTKTWGATYPVEYGHDVQGRMVLMKTFRDENGVGDETRWLYDNPTGLLTNKLYADGKGPSYTYTPDGKMASRLWARGILTAYAYDASGALLSVDYSDSTPDVTYTFDRLGNQLSVVSSVSTNLYAYSPQTLDLVSETQNGSVITRSADALGRSAGVGLGNSCAVAYGYDGFGRFTSVSSSVLSASSAVTYSYFPGTHLLAGYTVSSPVSHFQLQVSKTYEEQRDLVTVVSNFWDTSVIFAYDYANDAVGRRVSRHDSGLAFAQPQSNAFGYNQRSEVTSAVMYTNAYGYVYDPIGNRLYSAVNSGNNTYTANPLNQYTNIISQSYSLDRNSLSLTYDADGNMISCGSLASGDEVTNCLFWDAENRLILVSNIQFQVSNTYDYQSRRIRKEVTVCDEIGSQHHLSEVRTYLLDNWNILREVVVQPTINNQQPSVVTNYDIWGLDLTGTIQGGGGVGGLLAVTAVSTNGVSAYYPAYDANGNITGYLDTNDVLVARFVYDPFGNIVALSGDRINAFTHRFSTKPFDVETRLSYYGYRFYSSELGRWINRDPIYEKGGVQLYCFSLNDGIAGFDVLGKFCCKKDSSSVTESQMRTLFTFKDGSIPAAFTRLTVPVFKYSTTTCFPEIWKGKIVYDQEPTCRFHIYYYLSPDVIGSDEHRTIRQHEEVHVSLHELWWNKLDSKIRAFGGCACWPCVNARYDYLVALERLYLERDTQDNAQFDCDVYSSPRRPGNPRDQRCEEAEASAARIPALKTKLAKAEATMKRACK